MKIFLIGYMGSGKTFIGKRLAEQLKLEYIDLDERIEEIEGYDIPEIFTQKGEIYFRKRERQILEELLSTDMDSVISLGGGTPCFGNNMELIKSERDSVTFYLKLSIGSLTERLINEKDKRPLINHLQDRESLEDFIRKHLFERGFYYNQSEYIINCDGMSSAEIIKEITSKLG